MSRFVARSEIAGRAAHAVFVLRPLAGSLALAFAAAAGLAQAQALPSGATVAAGQASIVTRGAQMTVSNSPNAVLDWQSFSIGAGHGVRFEQQSASSQVLNRIVGHDASRIFGSLSSNGKVWLVNPNGVLFGPEARVNVGALFASTLDVSNADFLSGRARFAAAGTGPAAQLLNQGEIVTPVGGQVWLIGESVRNEGLIRTPGGSIVLAAGHSVEWVDPAQPHVVLRISAPANEALNLGRLIASADSGPAGHIELHGGIVNQQGLVRADSLATDGAGRIVLRAQGDLVLGAGSLTSASAAGAGRGGQVQLLGDRVGVRGSAVVDASGASGGGEILLGGDSPGARPELPRATVSYLGRGATLKANATGSGAGGRVVVWADATARVYGGIEARGGPAGGDGGFIETSSAHLDAQPRSVDASAPAGRAGTWLIDPNDITITARDGNRDIEASAFPDLTTQNDAAILDTRYLEQAIARGNQVLVRTGSAGASSQPGDITVAGSINVDYNTGCDGSVCNEAYGSLTLQAQRDIVVQPGVRIASVGGPMPVTLTADSMGSGAGRIAIGAGASIATSGGDIVLGGGGTSGRAIATASGAAGIGLAPGASLDAGSGRIALQGGASGAQGVGVRIDGASLSADAIQIDGRHVAGTATPDSVTGVDVAGAASIVAREIGISGDGYRSDDWGVRLGAQSRVELAVGAMTSARLAIGDASTRNVSLAGGLSASSPVRIEATGLTQLDATATVNSTAVDDAILIQTGRLQNAASSTALSAPNGRWLVYAAQAPSASSLGALDYDFVQFNAPYAATPVRPDNGLLYATPLDLAVQGRITRTYDGTTAADLSAPQYSGLPPAYAVELTGFDKGQGVFLDAAGAPDRNVGIDKPVAVAAIALKDSAGKPVYGYSGGIALVGDITPATLTYQADPAVAQVGQAISGLSGSVSGFIGGDTLPSATSGLLAWTTPADANSAPGSYAITGLGLEAGNYRFVQAEGNASALTLVRDEAAPASQSDLDRALQLVSPTKFPPLAPGLSDYSSLSGPLGRNPFGALDLRATASSDLSRWIEMRQAFKRKLFADAIHQLEIDPSLADLPPCADAQQAASGNCLLTAQQAQVTEAGPQPPVSGAAVESVPSQPAAPAHPPALPAIERKVALLFGLNDYADKKIPALQSAIPDVDAVARLFADRLGYEVSVVRNAAKADIVRELNRLAATLKGSDSVVVYYAGHGYSIEKHGAGYWIPSDAPASDPRRWISNSDVSKLLSSLRSRQVALISDSCYSGAFTREAKVDDGAAVDAAQVLAKRSVVVLSSGGDEPVTDEGKDGHSIFAWNLMNALAAVHNWTPGATVFTEVQRGVVKDFPQTPQYGAVTSAGHQRGGDYLFEVR